MPEELKEIEPTEKDIRKNKKETWSKVNRELKNYIKKTKS